MNSHTTSSKEKPEKVYLHFSKRITIYGSYFPLDERKRLNDLRKCIRERSFKNTNLAIDYPVSYFPFRLPSNPKRKNLVRSRYCLKTTDLNILIFTFKGEKTGVGYELEYAIRKKFDFLLFREVKMKRKKKIASGSSLIDGRLLEISRNYIEFPIGDNKFLCDAVYQRIIDFFL